MPARCPERIVCLTEETTETLYLLGEERRLVGISGYTVRPPRARREKPRVSAFLSAKHDAILALQPDLVLGFSDLQADIGRDLAKAGLNVVLFNQRSVDEILSMVLMLSSMVGATDRGQKLIDELQQSLEAVRASAQRLPRRPRVYFGLGIATSCSLSCGNGISMPRSSNASLTRFRYSRLTLSRSTGGTTLNWTRSTTAELSSLSTPRTSRSSAIRFFHLSSARID